MPHCIIEYAKPIEQQVYINDLVALLHEGMLASELFNAPAVKTRAIAFDHYKVGEGENLFVHVTVKMLDGRTPAQKITLSTALHTILSSMVGADVIRTVDIRDLDSDAYSK